MDTGDDDTVGKACHSDSSNGHHVCVLRFDLRLMVAI